MQQGKPASLKEIQHLMQYDAMFPTLFARQVFSPQDFQYTRHQLAKLREIASELSKPFLEADRIFARDLAKKLLTYTEEENAKTKITAFTPWSKGPVAQLDDECYFPAMKQETLHELDEILTAVKTAYQKQNSPPPQDYAPPHNIHVPEIYVPDSPSPEQSLEERILRAKKDYFSNKSGQILIPLAQNAGENAVQAESMLTTSTGGMPRTFHNLDYISLDIEHRQEKEIMRLLRSGNNSWLCRKRKIVPSTLVYCPELLTRTPEKNTQPHLLWNLHNIGVQEAHRHTKGQGITIGIIDTGVDYKHPELRARFCPSNMGWNYVDNNSDVMDKHNHGTHVAGTAAGATTGVAPMSQLKAYVVLGRSGSGSLANVMHALDDAITQQVDVVNMSLGSLQYIAAFDQLCRAAYSAGVIIAAAAGNESLKDRYSYPAAYPGVVGVAAVDRLNRHAPFSNANNSNDISAPGVYIYSTVPGGYSEMTGTSMACPHAAGSLALIKSAAPHFTPAEIARAMAESAKSIGNDQKMFGAGLIRPDYAINKLSSPDIS